MPDVSTQAPKDAPDSDEVKNVIERRLSDVERLLERLGSQTIGRAPSLFSGSAGMPLDARKEDGAMDTAAFLKLADKFIDVANRENNKVKATDLHMAFLYAAARYNAYVAKVVMNVDEHESFVTHMVEQYREMLRQHLAYDTLEPPR